MATKNGRGPAADITCDEVLVLREDFIEAKQLTVKLRVVVWRSGAKKYPAALEKREMYADRDTGELKNGKAKGFGLADMKLIGQRWPAIMAAMGNRLPEDQAGPGAVAQQEPAAAAGNEEEF